MAITMTEPAARWVKSYMADRAPAAGLRLGVKTTGCSGFAYVLDLVDDIGDDDHVFESNGVKIVVDPKSLPLIDGTRIDYARDGLNEGLQYDNPNVKSLCGCGESFGV